VALFYIDDEEYVNGKKTFFFLVFFFEVVDSGFRRSRPDMTTEDIWDLADACIEAGFFPLLAGRRFVLGLEILGTERVIIHRKEVSFRIGFPCRVWLLSGKARLLLGDSHALPGDLTSGVRPPYTG
ncbi:unnamed protein product, partial [marine sediment metagenome]